MLDEDYHHLLVMTHIFILFYTTPARLGIINGKCIMRNKRASIQKNYIYNLLYDILVLIVPFVTTPYISRVLNVDSIGLYSYTYSIIVYFTAFVALGTKSYAIKKIAQAKDLCQISYVFWNTVLLRFISGSLALATYYFYVFYIADNTIIALIQSIYIIAVIFDISWFFQGIENFKYIVLKNAIFKVLSVFLIFLLIKTDNDFFKYLFILSGTILIGNISLWTYLPKILTRINIRHIKPFTDISEIIVLFIPTLALQIYSATGNTMLGTICNDMSQNGYYEQANKIINILLTVITSLSIVSLPRISGLFANKEYKEIKDHMHQSYRFVMFLSFPMILGICSVSRVFIPWFLGDAYFPVISLVNVLSLQFLVSGINNITGLQYLVATNRQEVYAISIVFGVIANSIFNVALIPIYASMGVVISIVLSELMICIIQLTYIVKIKKEFSFRLIFSGIWRYLVGSILMSLGICFINKLILVNDLFILIIDVFGGCVFYFLFILFTKDPIVLSVINNLVARIKNK